MRIEFQLNGEDVAVEIVDARTLLAVLIEELGREDTPFGCTRGLCGACTVLLDGQARRACTLPAKDAHGKRVRTQRRRT